MTQTIVLPDKLPSSAVANLIQLLETAEGPMLCIDGRQVRTIGARAAEILARFKAEMTSAGGTLTIDPSADLEDDLRILGFHDRLIEKEPVK